ncbi:hypothetical protein GCM10027063_46710 [Promicromonospora xylanilytica]
MILPATPLLVPGVAPGLRTDPLAAVRDAVARALAELTAGGVLPLVLAHGPALRHGLLRPSLTGSGIGDRWLPGAAGLWADPTRPAAGTGASVALLALADVLGGRAAEIETLEVPPGAETLEGDPLDLLRHADGVVVAGGGAPGGQDSGPDALTGGIRAALRAAGAGAWTADVQVFEQAGDHLPPAYQVTRLTDRRIAV